MQKCWIDYYYIVLSKGQSRTTVEQIVSQSRASADRRILAVIQDQRVSVPKWSPNASHSDPGVNTTGIPSISPGIYPTALHSSPPRFMYHRNLMNIIASRQGIQQE
ncbi:hypothetical protein THAOC_16194 [Thalassiosira oceanica]|uniref:Uncharacterized protein n=1 Tax=Thalassiosira oceanica TaxID=159749 RepID=K0SYA6_THAOC|nr:hypothetical protein THAOC_16194 [Thalassiosira oceanica]|eukprot:EJK63172.1 hypothetical protein THAOC_16194 [Thalassiosira oceanica]